MRIGVALLFEGRFAEGAGALVNSLFRAGYRGSIFVGYRGRWPTWMGPEQRHEQGPGLEIVPVRIADPQPLIWCKARFLLELWADLATGLDAIYYFDSDITVISRWWLFNEWVRHGMAVCADVNAEMPAYHPLRAIWRENLDSRQRLANRDLDIYFNAGFLGIRREWEDFLERWERFNAVVQRLVVSEPWRGMEGLRTPWSARDQDAFNAALMLGREPLAPMGRDGMGFQSGGGNFVMAHPVGARKPWASSFLAQALRRRRPGLADRAFVANMNGLVMLYSPVRRLMRRLDLGIARALGAVVGR